MRLFGYTAAAAALVFTLAVIGVVYTGAALMALAVSAEDKAKSRWGGQ